MLQAYAASCENGSCLLTPVRLHLDWRRDAGESVGVGLFIRPESTGDQRRSAQISADQRQIWRRRASDLRLFSELRPLSTAHRPEAERRSACLVEVACEGVRSQ